MQLKFISSTIKRPAREGNVKCYFLFHSDLSCFLSCPGLSNHKA